MIESIKLLHTMSGSGCFLLKHREVRLLQIFKAEDVRRWNLSELEDFKADSLVIDLTLNDEVGNKKALQHNFEGSHFYSTFKRVFLDDEHDNLVYFSVHEPPIDYEQLQQKIFDLLRSVYQLEAGSDLEWGTMRFG